jgi:LuxR family transcriptional regulator, maltose regulon positive regulatory protein
MAIASLRLWLARRHAHLAGVVAQAGFLASPVAGQCGEEIAIANDLRAAALMNLGTVEAWSLALTDAECHLREGAALARKPHQSNCRTTRRFLSPRSARP